nr:MAG TPA: hypothetical protein [Caudoviricetes sp.]
MFDRKIIRILLACFEIYFELCTAKRNKITNGQRYKNSSKIQPLSGRKIIRKVWTVKNLYSSVLKQNTKQLHV